MEFFKFKCCGEWNQSKITIQNEAFQYQTNYSLYNKQNKQNNVKSKKNINLKENISLTLNHQNQNKNNIFFIPQIPVHNYKLSDHSTASNHENSSRSIIEDLDQSITDQILQNIQSMSINQQQVINLDDQYFYCQRVNYQKKNILHNNNKLPTIPQIKLDLYESRDNHQRHFTQSSSSISINSVKLSLANSIQPEFVFPKQFQQQRMIFTQEFPSRKFKNPNHQNINISKITKLEGKSVHDILKFKKNQ